jgi:hypothetical protein
LNDYVIFKGKRSSIKLNQDSIICDYPASYFPILITDILFLERRIQKGPKLRSIQLVFECDTTTELWALTINVTKWKGNFM